MKNAKIFKNVLSVAIAASLVAGCFALTGCDDKKDNKKDDKKSEKVEDEDEKEEKETKETKATETEPEETEAEETEAEETEAEETEEIEETEDIDIYESEFEWEMPEIELATADDFEDAYLKELCEKYTAMGYEVTKPDLSEISTGDDGIVEALMAGTGAASMSVNFDSEDEDENSASGFGKMTEIVAAKFESAEKADEFMETYITELEDEGYTFDIVEENGEKTVDYAEDGISMHLVENTESNVFVMEMELDLDAMFASFGDMESYVEEDDSVEIEDEDLVDEE